MTGEVAEHDGNGKTVALISYQGGFKHGREQRYFPDGTLRYQGEWTHGRGVGVHQAWYASGQLKEERHYSETGRLIQVRRWAEDGTAIGRQRPRPSP
ncbi:toxin-antitoxin system YwqK family antitoxin [Micromonospora pattaloongensis]|uniref:toxin-antitoxin system YwqK family antitoxin n=1 Tax=Micromonospora pattaloongensis TaxID=405436 RepID=UPI001587DD37|nr:hypothetical protein [Micromonospora pattaloongensis]